MKNVRYDFEPFLSLNGLNINTKDKTRMKFLTDGILLREVQRDPSLKEKGVFYQVTFFVKQQKKLKQSATAVSYLTSWESMIGLG